MLTTSYIANRSYCYYEWGVLHLIPRTNYRNMKPVLYTELGSLSTRDNLNTVQVAKRMRLHYTALIPKLMPLPICSVNSQNFTQHLQQGGPWERQGPTVMGSAMTHLILLQLGHTQHFHTLLNDLAQAITRITCRPPVPGSNVGQELRCLPQTLQWNTKIVSSYDTTTGSLYFLFNSLFATNQVIWR